MTMMEQHNGAKGPPSPSQSALPEGLTPEALTLCCKELYAMGQGVQATSLAIQAAQASQDIPVLLAAGLFLTQQTAHHDVAVAIFRKALLLLPQGHAVLASLQGELKLCLAGALMAAGKRDESIGLFMEIAQNYPEHRLFAGEHISMGLLEAGLADQAERVLAVWLQEGPPSVALYNNMGCALERLNRSREAMVYYQKGIELASRDEDVSFGYAMALLKAGAYEEGFARYVRRVPRMPNLSWWFYKDLPRLTQGVPLAGKRILFYQEQGLGDTIQFIRFLPEIARQAGHITIAALPPLARLLAETYPMVEVCLVAELLKTPERVKEYDTSCPIPDLPYLCDLKSPAALPPFTPYLAVPLERRAHFAQIVERVIAQQRGVQAQELETRRLRVGLVWAGDARTSAQDVASDKRRSSSFAEMMAAFGTVEADFFNLQYGPRRGELVGAETPQPVYDVMDEVQDMADTAALMEALDLIISVDTAPLHLAGALGREVWLVSRWDACWRWGDEGERTPWYPTMRIFRAQELSFVPVLQEVGADLRQRAMAI